MTTRERAHAALVAARQRITDPDRWTRKAPARDRAGHSREPESPQACRWCAIGAVGVEVLTRTPVDADGPRPGAWAETYNAALGYLTSAARRLFPRYSCAAQVNDKEGHGAALAILDEAARLAARPRGMA